MPDSLENIRTDAQWLFENHTYHDSMETEYYFKHFLITLNSLLLACSVVVFKTNPEFVSKIKTGNGIKIFACFQYISENSYESLVELETTVESRRVCSQLFMSSMFIPV